MFNSVCPPILLLYAICGITIHLCYCNNSSSSVSHGICDVGDAITSLHGSIVVNDGVDCSRVIVSPEGWRIRLTVHMNLFMYHASLYIYDGGTRSGTKSKHYVVGERIVNGDDIYYSTSNALVIHTDKITRLSTLNMTFVMFRQSPNRCGCRPVAQGQTVCTLSTDFYLWPDSLTRLCKISCEQSHGILTTEYSTITKSSLELQCGLNQDQADPIWKAFGAKLVDLNSVTCSGVNPSRQLMSSFTFNYKMSCGDIDLEFIQSQIFEHIVNSTNTSYGGECFKSRNVNIGNANCTVRRLNVSCSNPGHQTKSHVTLDVEDNYLEVRPVSNVELIMCRT